VVGAAIEISDQLGVGRWSAWTSFARCFAFHSGKESSRQKKISECASGRFPSKGFEIQVNNSHTDRIRTGSLYHVSDVLE